MPSTFEIPVTPDNEILVDESGVRIRCDCCPEFGCDFCPDFRGNPAYDIDCRLHRINERGMREEWQPFFFSAVDCDDLTPTDIHTGLNDFGPDVLQAMDRGISINVDLFFGEFSSARCDEFFWSFRFRWLMDPGRQEGQFPARFDLGSPGEAVLPRSVTGDVPSLQAISIGELWTFDLWEEPERENFVGFGMSLYLNFVKLHIDPFVGGGFDVSVDQNPFVARLQTACCNPNTNLRCPPLVTPCVVTGEYPLSSTAVYQRRDLGPFGGVGFPLPPGVDPDDRVRLDIGGAWTIELSPRIAA